MNEVTAILLLFVSVSGNSFYEQQVGIGVNRNVDNNTDKVAITSPIVRNIPNQAELISLPNTGLSSSVLLNKITEAMASKDVDIHIQLETKGDPGIQNEAVKEGFNRVKDEMNGLVYLMATLQRRMSSLEQGTGNITILQPDRAMATGSLVPSGFVPTPPAAKEGNKEEEITTGHLRKGITSKDPKPGRYGEPAIIR